MQSNPLRRNMEPNDGTSVPHDSNRSLPQPSSSSREDSRWSVVASLLEDESEDEGVDDGASSEGGYPKQLLDNGSNSDDADTPRNTPTLARELSSSSSDRMLSGERMFSAHSTKQRGTRALSTLLEDLSVGVGTVYKVLEAA